MVIRSYAINRATGEIDDGCLLTYYGTTPDDWAEMAKPGRFVEFIDGKLIVHSRAGLLHQREFDFLYRLLGGFVEQTESGEVLAGPFTMELAHERKFEPDLIFVAAATRGHLSDDRLLGPADLALEIASRSTRGYDRGEKRECYRVGGVREYWMIDPFDHIVTLDRPAGHEVLRTSAGVVRSETCPGFWLQAEWLWQDPLPKVSECLKRIQA